MDKKMLVIFIGGAAIAAGVMGYGVGQLDRFDDGRPYGRMMNAQQNNVRGDDGQKRQDGRFDGRGGKQDGRGGGMGMMDGSGSGRGMGMGLNRENCVADDCLAVDGLDYPAGTLSDAAKAALTSALDDEYKAYAAYESIVAKFGEKRPFIMIRRSEEQHISALKALFEKYGMTIPANPWLGKVVAPETFQASCQMGVDAEIANAALYRDTLLPAAKDYADITAVFSNLMNASQERHLPAFDRCN